MQPPPIPIIEYLSLATMTTMITITFLMQASGIAFHSRMVREYKGVVTACLATVSLGLGFGVLLIRPIIGERFSGSLSNLLLMTGYVLIYIAICQFVDKKPHPFLIRGLIPFGYVALITLILLPRGIPIILVTQLTGLSLNIASALVLYRADTKRYTLGAYLTGIPLLLYGVITIIRFTTGILFPRELMPGPSFSNLFDVLSLFVLSYLWTFGFILMISQRLQSDLNDLAMNDALTRVRNRRAMQSMLDFEMRRVQTDIRDFSVILLDVDHFKRINDTYGHDVGDTVLRWMAQTLQSEVRVQDIVSRWGGEEFLILLPDTNLESALETAERLRALVERSAITGGPVPIHITFSGGVSNSNTNRDVDQLCKVADQALYLAKRTRNCIISQTMIPATE